MKTAIVYSCFLTGKWYSLVSNQLTKIFSSKTVLNGGDVFICASGTDEEYKKLIEIIGDNKAFVYHHPNIKHACEAYGFKKMHEISKEGYDYICFMHSKGVSRLKDPMPVIITVNTWRTCMEYFVLERAEDCISALQKSNKNCAGVMLDVFNWFHKDISFEKSVSHYLWAIFPGNFFWVKCSWFAEQKEPTIGEDRFEYERFLGTCVGTNPYYIWIKKYSEVGSHISYFEPIYEQEYKKEYKEEYKEEEKLI
jgi:hypothetical protein